MQNNILLFDIDYTLFDVGKYRRVVFTRLNTFFPNTPSFMDIAEKAYAQVREKGWFEISTFTRQLLRHVSTNADVSQLKAVWEDATILTSCLYPEVENVLQTLEKKNYTMGIFSSGNESFQKSKIATIAHFFQQEHIHIHQLKDEKIDTIVRQYKEARVLVVDDYMPVIEKAKKADSTIITIWVKRGRFAQKIVPTLAFQPDFTVDNLTQLLTLPVI